MKRLLLRLPVLALALTAAAFVGCAGYRLGPTNGTVAGEKSIEVRPFVNATLEPRLVDPVTSTLRRALQQDGTYRLATDGSADVVVTGTLTAYKRGELGFQPNDTLTVRDYFIELTARVVAVERGTGKTNLNRTVTGRTTVRVGTDLAAAERQAAPMLAADLARNIASLLVDGTW
jgi:hypothetical protein